MRFIIAENHTLGLDRTGLASSILGHFNTNFKGFGRIKKLLKCLIKLTLSKQYALALELKRIVYLIFEYSLIFK